MQQIGHAKKYLFISIRPEFITKFLGNEKKIELRKVKPNVNVGDFVIMYATSPLKSVIAIGIIEQIIDTSPGNMWKQYSSYLGIDKYGFDNYYDGKERAIGIELKDIIKTIPIHLNYLRTIMPNFQPPQIYKYLQDIDNIKKFIPTNSYNSKENQSGAIRYE